MTDVVWLSLGQMKQAVELILEDGHVPAIVGGAGIGKTESLTQIALENGGMFKTITCSLMQEGDLMLPIPKQYSEEQDANNLRTVTRALDEDIVQIIEFLETEGNEDKTAYLLLDELNRASTAVQGELMNLVLAKELKGVKIPDGCKILVAMNPSSDMSDEFADTNYAVNAGDSAIMDRMTYVYVRPDLSEWADWGSEVVPRTGLPKVDPRIVTFLENTPQTSSSDTSYFNMKESDGKITATPRSWVRASNHLVSFERKGLGKDFASIRSAMIQGAVGHEAGMALENFLVNIDTHIVLSDVLNTEPNVSEAVVRKFEASSDLSRTAFLKGIVRKVNSDLASLEQTPISAQPYPENFSYLQVNVIEKFIELIGKLQGRNADNAQSVYFYAHRVCPHFWEFASNQGNEIFQENAIAVRAALLV